MKKLSDFTLKEYEKYYELVKGEDFNVFEILELFGYKNSDNLEVGEFNKIVNDIFSQKIEVPPLKLEYEVNGKHFKLITMIKDIKAGQFIDYQIYLKEVKLHQLLSIFLLPITICDSSIMKRKIKKVKNYNDGYDLIELQDFLYNNFKISDAMAISNFFLNLSASLLPIIQNSLMLQMAKEKIRLEKMKKKNELIG